VESYHPQNSAESNRDDPFSMQPSALSKFDEVSSDTVEPFFALKIGVCSFFCNCGPRITQDSHEISFNSGPRLVAKAKARRSTTEYEPIQEDDSEIITRSFLTNGVGHTLSVVEEGGSYMDLTTLGGNDESRRGTADGVPSAASAAPARPDFTGTWLLTHVEGDWESFLSEQGIGYMKRQLMRGLGYGVGKLKEQIQQTEMSGVSHLKVSAFSPMGQIDNEYFVNGTDQDGKNPEGESIIFLPQWEGDRLVCEVKAKSTNIKTVTQRRSLVDGQVRVSMEGVSGIIVERHFTRQ